MSCATGLPASSQSADPPDGWGSRQPKAGKLRARIATQREVWMMDVESLVERLWQRRQSGDDSPAWLNGILSLELAHTVQLGRLARKVAAGEVLAGWKVRLTSNRARTAGECWQTSYDGIGELEVSFT
jgi:hypothetical protein